MERQVGYFQPVTEIGKEKQANVTRHILPNIKIKAYADDDT